MSMYYKDPKTGAWVKQTVLLKSRREYTSGQSLRIQI